MNRYTLLRRLANKLIEASPFFSFTKRISRPFKIRRLKKKMARFRFPESPRENDPLFTSVEIETINRCNGNCGFCPVNHKQDPRPFRRMSRDLFLKIIDELAAIDYDRSVSLFSNNEPLLDTRIHEFAEHARAKLPSARLAMYTNGTLLNLEKFKKLVDNLDSVVIDNYCTDYKLRPNLAEIAECIDSSPETRKKAVIHIRYENEVLTTRGGQAPNAHRKPRIPLAVGCLLPTSQMIIRPDGKLSLCCNDALGTVTIGDVGADGLVAAWNGGAARGIRRNVIRSRACFDICKGCDTLY